MQRYVTSVEAIEVDFDSGSAGEKIALDWFPTPPRFPCPEEPLNIYAFEDPDAALASHPQELARYLRVCETSVSEFLVSIRRENPEFLEHFAKVIWFVSWYLWCWGEKTICRSEIKEIYLALINWLVPCPVFLKATSTISPIPLGALLKFATILVKMSVTLGSYSPNWYACCWASTVVLPQLLRKTLQPISVRDTEWAIERVKEKIERGGIKNVKPILTNASSTGLPDRSVDLAFSFGLRYIAGGLEDLISEMYRILEPGAALSFEKTRGSEERLIEEVEREGFTFSERTGRVFLFTKGKEMVKDEI